MRFKQTGFVQTLEHVSEFKHLGYALDESGTDVPECSGKVDLFDEELEHLNSNQL